jgi:hypothetical protein
MSVNVIYECDGCSRKSEPVRMGRKFKGISGRSHGFGVYVYDQPKDMAPKGWTAFDHIGCCYCPTCTDELFPEEDV